MTKRIVLLVDDELDCLRVVGQRIIEWGYGLIEATNGRMAVESVQTKNPDIIILDYMLPDMNGITTLSEIRKINNNIPVIMYTAHPEMKVIREAEKFNISAFIPKSDINSNSKDSLKVVIDMVSKNLDKRTQ